MYGTIFRMKAKAGKDRAIAQLFEEWERTRQPKARGAIGGYLFKSGGADGHLTGVAVFADRASYQANAEDPEQDRWFTRLREQLQEDPAWDDGEILVGMNGQRGA